MISFTMNKWLRHNDADDVSLYVQECGGEFAIRKRHIEFYVPIEHSAIVALKFPFLRAEQYVWNDRPDTFWPPENT